MKRTRNTEGGGPLAELREEIVQCRRCPRLVKWREAVAAEKVARFKEWNYWGKPVPGFGDPDAGLLIVGLAPAAHGGNRTGRMFTGDRSGDWLAAALYKFGFSNKKTSVSRDDGLRLRDCYIAAAARCAPPQNKLLPAELRSCRPFLSREIRLLRNVRVVVALGRIAFDTVLDSWRELGLTSIRGRRKFMHGAEVVLNDRQTLLASFHPSQQNTFTGKLTAPMFEAVFRRSRAILKSV